MAINYGIRTEDEFVYFLNGKKPCEISNNLRRMMVTLFGIVDDSLPIECEKTKNFIKPDIIIRHRGIEKAVSIKSGKSQFLHGEQIRTFVLFLRSLGVSSKTQQTFLLFLYGDGTMDGSGEVRHSKEEVVEWLRERIYEANAELNCNNLLIAKFIERIIFQGVDPEARCADALYQGNIKSGTTIVKEQVMKHIRMKDWTFTDNFHIGPIMFTATQRFVNKPVTNKWKQNTIQCYWNNFIDDVRYISKRYSSYSSPYSWRPSALKA